MIFALIFLILYLGLLIFVIAGYWKTFEKAHEPGWACIVPIYSFYVLAKIGGVKNWGLIFVPIYNIYFIFVVMIAVAKAFGKDSAFGIGLVFLGLIFFPILGFGSATYSGPNGVNELEQNVNIIGNN